MKEECGGHQLTSQENKGEPKSRALTSPNKRIIIPRHESMSTHTVFIYISISFAQQSFSIFPSELQALLTSQHEYFRALQISQAKRGQTKTDRDVWDTVGELLPVIRALFASRLVSCSSSSIPALWPLFTGSDFC